MVPVRNSNTSLEHQNTWNIGTWYQTGALVPAHLRVVSRNNTADVLCGGPEGSNRDTIFQANKSILYHKGKLWVKKGDSLFDVTMGSYGGAEVCELVGLYFLFKLADLLNTNH